MELLWRRALAETGERIYCLVRGDLLDYYVSQKAVDCLHTLMQDYPEHESKDFFLILIIKFCWLISHSFKMDSFVISNFPRPWPRNTVQ